MNTTAPPFGNGRMPRDLRGGGPAEAGAGKTYPVDPAAVERLKAHMAAKEAAPARQAETAVGAPGTQSTKREKANAPAANLAAIYPAEAVAAAQEQRKAAGRRDLVSVFTPDVLAVWHRWHEDYAWQRILIQQPGNICRNCLRVQAANKRSNDV